jgi:hypothetical protein
MDYTFLLIGGAQFLFGSVFLAGSVFLMIGKKLRMNKWTKTTGTVIDVQVSQGMRQPMGTTRNTLFRPKVRFQTADGRVIDYEPRTSNSWSNYSAGQKVEVYYDPQKPEKAIFGTSSGQWFGLIVFALVGIFLVLLGAVFVLINLFNKF